MTEQQTPDREKKIAEIREGYKSERDDNFTYKKEIVEQDIRFLLSELDRAEKELELFDQRGETIERQLNIIEQLQEENRKLRQERDAYYNNARYTEAAFHEVTSLRSQLQSAQQREQKLIEGLREIDTHIRSTSDPIPHIVETLKRLLPEYK